MLTRDLFNSQFALDQLGEDTDLLSRMLERFTSQYSNSASQAQDFLQQGHWQEARHLIHTIKGVAGNLGMHHLYQTSNLVEQLIKQQPEQAMTEMSRFRESLQQTLKAINHFQTQQAKPAVRIPVGVQLEADQARQQLQDALQRNEFLSPARLDSMLMPLPLAEAVRHELRGYINDLDYTAALALLQDSTR